MGHESGRPWNHAHVGTVGGRGAALRLWTCSSSSVQPRGCCGAHGVGTPTPGGHGGSRLGGPPSGCLWGAGIPRSAGRRPLWHSLRRNQWQHRCAQSTQAPGPRKPSGTGSSSCRSRQPQPLPISPHSSHQTAATGHPVNKWRRAVGSRGRGLGQWHWHWHWLWQAGAGPGVGRGRPGKPKPGGAAKGRESTRYWCRRQH